MSAKNIYPIVSTCNSCQSEYPVKDGLCLECRYRVSQLTHNQSELEAKIIEIYKSRPLNDTIHEFVLEIIAYITANYTPNSEVQDLVATSMADAADEASKNAINQLTMGGEWVPASEVAERERVARINEGQLFREAMIEHSTPAIYWGDRLDELREDKL